MPFPTSPHVTCVATTLLNHSVAEYRCVALTIINAATAVLITQDPESASSAYQCWVGTATYCCTRCVCVCVCVCVSALGCLLTSTYLQLLSRRLSVGMATLFLEQCLYTVVLCWTWVYCFF